MDWYIPITILPAIGLIIMSTANQLIAVSSEIRTLLSSQCNRHDHEVVRKKIRQLNRLTKSLVALYASSACFVLSGILRAFLGDKTESLMSESFLYIGTIIFLASLIYLIRYSLSAVLIRRFQYEYSLNDKVCE